MYQGGQNAVGAYLRDTRMDVAREQPLWRRVAPVLVLGTEFDRAQVAQDGRHRDRTVSPWRTKVELERVILHILDRSVMLERKLSLATRQRLRDARDIQSDIDRQRGGQQQPWISMASPPHTRPWSPCECITSTLPDEALRMAGSASRALAPGLENAPVERRSPPDQSSRIWRRAERRPVYLIGHLICMWGSGGSDLKYQQL